MKNQCNIKVKKFGGTSLGTLQRIEAVAKRVLKDIQKGESPVIVCSAMSGETNRLAGLSESIYSNYRGEAYDMLLASGEQVSISLLTMALEKIGVKAKPLLAYQLGIKTDSIFSKARIESIDVKKIEDYLSQGVVPVVAGFQGISGDRITTLGRGGSDTSAVALAAAIGSKTCEIYTDVPAICTADPRLVDNVSEILSLSFEEMMEMASLGSKVLHFRSVELAAKYGVKIHLRSSFEDREGTWVVPEGEIMEKPVVSAVTHEDGTAVFKIFPISSKKGILGDLFTALAEKNIVVDIITQSQNEQGQRLAFSISESDIFESEKILKSFFDDSVEVLLMKNRAKISTVGVGMKNHPGVAARFFKILNDLEVPIHLVTTSEIKISAVIDSQFLKETATALHREFSLDRNSSL